MSKERSPPAPLSMTMGTSPADTGRVAEDMPRWVALVGILRHVLAADADADADAPTLLHRIRGDAALDRSEGSLRVLVARRAAAVEFNILLVGTLALLPIFELMRHRHHLRPAPKFF